MAYHSQYTICNHGDMVRSEWPPQTGHATQRSDHRHGNIVHLVSHRGKVTRPSESNRAEIVSRQHTDFRRNKVAKIS